MYQKRILLLLAFCAAAGAQAKPPKSAPGQFDYYAVAMSWSPSYCSSHADASQCSRGLGFVLHGLWPQYEKGYPEDCSTQRVPAPVRASYAALYPSPTMLDHEWRKHGSCSGLDPAAYFSLSSKLKEQLVIPGIYQHPATPLRASPGELVQAFKAVNPGIAQDSVLPFCGDGGRFLSEIHACYDKDARSRSCSAGEIKRSYNSCRKESFLLPSVR